MYYSRILVPVDTTSDSLQAPLETACEIAKEFHALIHVMSVIPSDVFEGHYPDATEVVGETKKQLKDLIRKHCPSDARVEISVEQGAVCAEILRVAQQRLVDVIVMASHAPAKGHVSRAYAAHVARNAPCSVFIVREESYSATKVA